MAVESQTGETALPAVALDDAGPVADAEVLRELWGVVPAAPRHWDDLGTPGMMAQWCDAARAVMGCQVVLEKSDDARVLVMPATPTLPAWCAADQVIRDGLAAGSSLEDAFAESERLAISETPPIVSAR